MWDSTAHVWTTMSIQYTSVLRVSALVWEVYQLTYHLKPCWPSVTGWGTFFSMKERRINCMENKNLLVPHHFQFYINIFAFFTFEFTMDSA